MKKFLIYLLLVSMCGGSEESVSTSIEEEKIIVNQELTEEETPVLEDETSVAKETTSTQVPVAKEIAWGKTNDQPKVYAAEDVSQATIDLTVEWVNKAIGHWGNYGPLEIWIVGTGKDETIALDKKWCEVRSKKDPAWNKEWDCANGDPYESGDGWSPFYRYITDGGAAVSTYIRDGLDYYFNALIMSSKYPGPEEEDYKPVVMHEYFHVYQHSNLSVPKSSGRAPPVASLEL